MTGLEGGSRGIPAAFLSDCLFSSAAQFWGVKVTSVPCVIKNIFKQFDWKREPIPSSTLASPILQTLKHFKRAVQLKVSERSDQDSSASHLRIQLFKENETKVKKKKRKETESYVLSVLTVNRGKGRSSSFCLPPVLLGLIWKPLKASSTRLSVLVQPSHHPFTCSLVTDSSEQSTLKTYLSMCCMSPESHLAIPSQTPKQPEHLNLPLVVGCSIDLNVPGNTCANYSNYPQKVSVFQVVLLTLIYVRFQLSCIT